MVVVYMKTKKEILELYEKYKQKLELYNRKREKYENDYLTERAEIKDILKLLEKILN